MSFISHAHPETFSSYIMSGLIAWKNNDEENNNSAVQLATICAKTITSEIAFGILTLTSSIATAAYGIFAMVFLVLWPITNEPFLFFASLMSSSVLTVGCGASNLYSNLFHARVYTLEEYELYTTPILVSQQKKLNRLAAEKARLQAEILELKLRLGYGGIFPQESKEERKKRLLIEQGTKFICEEVLANASEETKIRFKGLDADLFMFIFTKAIAIYTVGHRSKDEIPNLFTSLAKKEISVLRKKQNDKKTVELLKQLLQDPLKLEENKQQDLKVKALLIRLQGIASEELQRCVDSLLMHCWTVAAQRI